jgi:nucleoside-diphosphate-sugar epimerase
VPNSDPLTRTDDSSVMPQAPPSSEWGRPDVRVAVTGATGFIGLHTVRAVLAAGDEPVAVVRPSGDAAPLRALGIAPAYAELTDELALAAAFERCAAVVHLAGGGFPDRRTTWQTNVEGTRHVIAACRGAGVPRLLVASTVTVTRERLGAYGESKRAAERLALESGLDAAVVRFAFVYGAGRTGVFARLVEAVRRLPIVPIVGSGKLDIAPVYVDDVASAIVAAVHRDKPIGGRVYTLAGPPASLDELVHDVLTQLGMRKRTVHLPGLLALALSRLVSPLPNPPLTRDNVLGMLQAADHDSALARSELAFDPRPLADGLRATFASV